MAHVLLLSVPMRTYSILLGLVIGASLGCGGDDAGVRTGVAGTGGASGGSGAAGMRMGAAGTGAGDAAGSGAAGMGAAGAGSAGTTGTSDGGTGGTGGSPLTLPPCLQQLMTACPTQGACVRESGRICYASGAKVVLESEVACSGMQVGNRQYRVLRTDGSLCYTLEISALIPWHACEDGHYTWRDPAGQVVATGGFYYSGMSGRSASCAQSGQGVSCQNQDCRNVPFPGLGEEASCIPGSCR